jgi:uncharacterized protein (TIGR00269 family)
MANTIKCRCGKEAVFFRKYEGTHLCAPHFIQSIERKAMKTVSKFGMVKPGDHLIFALSGGKDSSVACHILASKLRNWKNVRLAGVSVDEGVGKYRRETIKSAARLCRNLGVDHHVFSFRKELGFTLEQKLKQIRKREPESPYVLEPCTICSIGRRHVLNKAARELGATKLCLGHNLDDEAQSVFMNFIRGDIQRASRGGAVTDFSISLGAKKFIPRIKPLREIPEREIALYAWLKKIPHHTGICPYSSGLRLEVRSFINRLEMLSPGVKFSILHTYDKILPRFREAAGRHPAKVKNCKKCGEPAPGEICRSCELWG